MQMAVAFLGGAAAAGVAAVFSFFWWRKRDTLRAGAAEERTRWAERRKYAENLAGGLIHEIKNPLNTLSLNLQLLAEDWAHAETQEERRALRRVQRLQAETKRLNAILDEFMGFVRDRTLRLAECDVNGLVEELVMFVGPELESKGIQVRTSYGATGRCALDRNLMKQALLNLVLNAEQALEGAATREIMVRTAREGGAGNGGETVRIDIIDTGRGIAPAEREKVFEVFFSTRQGGTGLGLPATRRIVEEHGGTIEVHSDHGRGTCFTVWLPGAGEAPAAGKEVQAA